MIFMFLHLTTFKAQFLHLRLELFFTFVVEGNFTNKTDVFTFVVNFFTFVVDFYIMNFFYILWL